MSNYTKSTNFATKDNLTPGDPLKVVRGTEIDTEYNNIATAIATKTDNASAAITGGTITGITDLAVADGGTGASTAAGGLNNLLPTQTGNANKYLQTDGTNATWDAVTLSTADITGTLPVANGGTGVTASTGTGSVVLSNSPTLVTPVLGTPASGTATNLTGLPISTGVSGLGTGVATFLGTPSSANLASAVSDETGTGALVFANTPTLVTPILGTPTSGTLTNATGLPIATGVSGLGTGVATFLATPSSANLAAALTDETGSGANVFATSPTLVTPALGTPSSAVLTNATGLPNAGLVNSSITIGGTAIALGASSNALANDITVNGIKVGRGAGAVADNTAVGSDALRINSTGSANTAIGYQAGFSNSAGSVTAVGFQAAYANTTAYNITVVGTQAGYSNQAGLNNTFIGTYAGYSSNFSGTALNTFVGYASGINVSTGIKNTILGSYNGNQDSLDIRTADNYVVLSDGDGNRQITMKEGQTLALDSAVPNAGTGITFPATQSASSNANTLDDYEEGTWTPDLTVGFTVVGATTLTGTYTKIGNTVFVRGTLQAATSLTSAGGNTRVTGFPFTSSTSTGVVFAIDDLSYPGTGFFSGTTAGLYNPTYTAGSNTVIFTFSYTV